jgi:hypothetical protein
MKNVDSPPHSGDNDVLAPAWTVDWSPNDNSLYARCTPRHIVTHVWRGVKVYLKRNNKRKQGMCSVLLRIRTERHLLCAIVFTKEKLI